MSRLPRSLQPLWPVAKRVHLLATRTVGWAARLLSPLLGTRGLPRHASTSSAATAADPTARARLHSATHGENIDRPSAQGEPALHHTFEAARRASVPAPYVLELAEGTVVGDYGAIVAANKTFDFETSRYFSVYEWREHPLFLRGILPKSRRVSGTALSLATRGGGRNYYHFLLEVMPRLALAQSLVPDLVPATIYAPHGQPYARELFTLAGVESDLIIPTETVAAVTADRLLVPSYPNLGELQPTWLVEWTRRTFPALDVADKPKRLFVTRGAGPNTRRLVSGPAIEAALADRGFTTIDPGTMSVRDQIDHFAGAEVIVGIHGAAMTNVVFCQPGVRVLELFAPAYVKHCYWAVLQNIPGAEYRYLLGHGTSLGPDKPMYGLQDDIELSASEVCAVLDRLLAD